MGNMKLIPFILLVATAVVHQPINKRRWITFMQPKVPTYDVLLKPEDFTILNAASIPIEQKVNTLATMVHKSVKQFQKHLNRYSENMIERIKRATTSKSDYGFVKKPELRHQYSMLFNHHGQVISGLKNIDLFLSIDLPKTEDIAHIPPEFPDCDNWAAPHKSQKHSTAYYSILGFGTDGQGPMAQFNDNTTHFLAEPLHIAVCNEYKVKYAKLFQRIETIKKNITYKIEKVMPRLMPNESAIIYGKDTKTDVTRQKRAIPLGLIFSGVSAIGGLIMKSVNTWSNYKKSKAMTKAVEQLYEAQEIDHKRLTHLEGQTSLLAKTTKTAFQHID